jgi:pilus assembly protein Flp/PilA
MGGVTMIWNFFEDEKGATAIEYGLIAGLISLAIFTGVGNVGSIIEGMWSDNADRLEQAIR